MQSCKIEELEQQNHSHIEHEYTPNLTLSLLNTLRFPSPALLLAFNDLIPSQSTVTLQEHDRSFSFFDKLPWTSIRVPLVNC